MANMETPASVRQQIAAEAVDWLLIFHGGGDAAADHAAFSEWLLRSPTHVAEYLAVSTTWIGLDVPSEGDFSTEALIAAARRDDGTGNVVRMSDHQAAQLRPVPQEPEAPGLIAGRPVKGRLVKGRLGKAWGSLAAAVLLGVGLWLLQGAWNAGTDYGTAVGEQRSVTLADGSLVYLNTNSLVRVRWTTAERHIDLVRGEARFQVVKNPARPFVVATTRATVRAVGTIFNVRADQGGTQVAVIEGRVEVKTLVEPVRVQSGGRVATTLGASAQLAAGEHAEVTAQGIEPGAGQPLEAVTAWSERRLVFRGETLATVVAEFNRYRSQPLILDDPQLAALKISGAFDLGDPESLLTYLKSFETVRVEYSRDGAEHLSRESVSTESTH
jgi:transmembrane sensor